MEHQLFNIEHTTQAIISGVDWYYTTVGAESIL